MKKPILYLYFFLTFICLFSKPLNATMNYDAYVEDWNFDACTTSQACGSCWPTCHFAWNQYTTCVIAFASFGYVESSPYAGVIYGITESQSVLQKTVGLVQGSGGKIKMSYGGATNGYHFWDQPVFNSDGSMNESFIQGMAKNIASALGPQGFYNVDKDGNQSPNGGGGFNGVDLDFEGTPPTGAGAAFAYFVKQLRSQLPKGSIISITMPSQWAWGTPTNDVPGLDPTKRVWANNPEYHAVLDNLSLPDGSIDFTQFDCINFMEYCFDITPGYTQVLQATKDIDAYHTGYYQIPYEHMALGMEQYCCQGAGTCTGSAKYMDPAQATQLATYANQNKLFGVFLWTLTQEAELSNVCSNGGSLPISTAISAICGQTLPPPQLNAVFKQPAIRTANTNKPLRFINRSISQPENVNIQQP